MNRTFILLAAGLFLSGCASTSTRSDAPPVVLLGQQLTRQDSELVGQRFRTLLDFEHDADAVFVRGASGAVTAAAHTGSRSLSIDGTTAMISIDPLMYGAKLPADWTLLGGYVRVPGGGSVRTALVVDGNTICESDRQTAADAWVFAAVDLTDPNLITPLANAKSIALSIRTQTGGFLLDDVLLVNNRKTLVEKAIPEFAAWRIDR